MPPRPKPAELLQELNQIQEKYTRPSETEGRELKEDCSVDDLAFDLGSVAEEARRVTGIQRMERAKEWGEACSTYSCLASLCRSQLHGLGATSNLYNTPNSGSQKDVFV
ncbi:hypothetical protein HYV84_05995 [Candidatus Woesearchaeota archaeon]|nr:hypothetical protein [Candidatus Woesearchaeota archaeon]